MNNLRVNHRRFTKFGVDVATRYDETESNRLSFYFKDGENWHFEVKKNATKEELLSCLLGTAELIKKSIIDARDKQRIK